MFMTLNIMNWDGRTRRLAYTGAGHEHIIIYRANGAPLECIRAGGVACGVLERANAMYTEKIIEMEEGDQVVLYSDGVTEAMNEEHDEYGLDPLKDIVQKYGDHTPLDLINAIHEEVKKFRGTAEPHDDITLVALRAKPQIFAESAADDIANLLDGFD
jgi:sigma-B regulation protein RsbU (phosphoserine phosphatase)